MDTFSVTQLGKVLSKSKYTIDLDNKTFSSKEDHLVLDFTKCFGWAFKTGSHCTFKTGSHCTFKTGWDCTFKTGDNCTFTTGNGCTFTTSYKCNFNTLDNCIFNTGSECTFSTGEYCTFKTLDDCTFKTGKSCVFMVSNVNTHTFKSTDDISIILDREDNKRYVLDKEFLLMQKLLKG